MKRLQIDTGSTGPAILAPLPGGFGLFLDLRHRAMRFGGYGQALYEFLDYERGLQAPWDWSMLYNVPVNQGAARAYEQWRDNLKRKRLEKLSQTKWPFVYVCWKCPKTHLTDLMTAAEADKTRKLYGVEIRRISWLGYLMRVGQVLLFANIRKLSNKR